MSDHHPVLLITGASRGIGAASAQLAASRGYAVCVNYLHRADDAHAVVDSIKQSGGAAIAVQADVSSETDVSRLFQTVDEQLGPIAALVNNAGTLELQSRV